MKKETELELEGFVKKIKGERRANTGVMDENELTFCHLTPLSPDSIF